MTAHAKVTPIAHTAAGMGQVWYRVTGAPGVANRQAAYRVGVGAEDVRRVRFVGAGATAQLLGFRPGDLVTSLADLAAIEASFTGNHLTHGVKTQRSRLARVPAEPIRALVLAALAAGDVDPSTPLFASRDANNWWLAVDRAGRRGRSVSFLTAAGVLRVLERHGYGATATDLHTALGAHLRGAAESPVPVRGRRRIGSTTLADNPAWMDGLTDAEVGERAWGELAAAAARQEPVGNAGYELTLTLPKSFSLHALSGPESLSGEWLDAMEAAATRSLEQLMAEAGFCSSGHGFEKVGFRGKQFGTASGFGATDSATAR